MKILVVDNTPLFRQVISQVFDSAGLETFAADTGEAAIKAIAAGNVQLVCSSYYLADTTGIDLCRRLRALPFGRFLPFILFTAEQVPTVLRNAYAAGVTDIFEKQQLDRLLTFIQRLLAQNEPITGNVLVVEDSPSMASLYGGLLERFGLTVKLVGQAEEALAYINQHDLDLIVTDIVLGGPMSGVTLVNQVRRLPGLRGEVPILAVTAFDDPARRVELFRLGVNDYVLKPVAGEELGARARNLISHYRLLREARSARSSAEAERELAQGALAYRASHDMLTGLANRWAFEQHLGALVADPETRRGHALALVEVTTLGIVNDAAGHEAGDALMREIGRRVRSAQPESAFAARLEGSRLAMVLPTGNPTELARDFDVLTATLSEGHFVWAGHSYLLSVCAGGVASLADSGSVVEAVSRAELAMAAAQRAGSSPVLIYDAQDPRISAQERERGVLPELLRALDGAAFALCVQRIVPVNATGPGGHEFLCRMIARDGALLAPEDFIPAAERYRLMPRIDRRVTQLALDWIASRASTGAAEGFYTINLSGQTLADEGFVDDLRTALAERALPGDCLCFDLRESALLADLAHAQRFMSAVRALGCRFALDDFGSASVSYQRLRDLPISLLKVDGQCVRGAGANAVDLAIVRSTCEVATAMGLQTVAEGVENPADLAILRDLGIDYAQGFALALPETLTHA